MADISDHMNSKNHDIYYHDQMVKIIVNLGSKKSENNDSTYSQLSYLQNSLSVSIVYTPENYLYNVDGGSDTRKVCTPLVNLYLKLFYVQYVKCTIEFIVIKILRFEIINSWDVFMDRYKDILYSFLKI